MDPGPLREEFPHPKLRSRGPLSKPYPSGSSCTNLCYFFPLLSSVCLCGLNWLTLQSHHWGSEKGGQVGSPLTGLG